MLLLSFFVVVVLVFSFIIVLVLSFVVVLALVMMLVMFFAIVVMLVFVLLSVYLEFAGALEFRLGLVVEFSDDPESHLFQFNVLEHGADLLHVEADHEFFDSFVRL